MLRPSTKPAALRPSWNGGTTRFKSLDARLLRNPITGRACCCARAASGHAAAAPPRRVMKARLFIRSPRRPPPAVSAESSVQVLYSGLRPANFTAPLLGFLGDQFAEVGRRTLHRTCCEQTGLARLREP